MHHPEKYVGASGVQYRDVKDIMNEFTEEVKKMKGKIIDIGCGPGVVTNDLVLPHVGQDAVIVGADISSDMVQYAKKHYGNDRMSFLKLDIGTCELSDNLIGQFDNATSFYCLHWCRDVKLSTGNIYKLLRPGGKAVVILCSYNVMFDINLEQHKDPRFSIYMQDVLQYMPPHYGYSNAEDVLRKELEEVGFKVLHCTNRWRTFSYKSEDLLVDMRIAANPFFHRMPENVKQDYIKDMEERTRDTLLHMRKNENSNNTIYDRYSMLVAVFEKPINQ